jgi:ABC-type multidrug transport system ATPase subunit
MPRPSSSSNARPLRNEAVVPSVEFSDLSLSLYTHEHIRFLQWKRELKRTVVSDLFGILPSGTITAILGPSGSGKTTVMNAIAGRANPGNYFAYSLTISTSVGGHFFDAVKFRTHFGFAHAHETLFPTDTPTEAFEFVAKLRGITQDAHVEELIRQLNLISCKDTYIGSTTLKGLSSGEQKRVSVGIELIPDPQILFLDEPTTGLDSSAAYKLTRLLKTLTTEKNACIICVLHQPSNKILALIDQVILMSKDGRICYWGPSSMLTDYFALKGYLCPLEYNPADYVMFLLQTLSESAINDLVSACKDSLDSMRVQIDHLRQNPLVGADAFLKTRPYNIRQWVLEVTLLVQREYRSTVRDMSVVVLRVSLALVFGTFISFLFFQVGANPAGAIDSSHIGLVSTLGIFALVSSAQSLIISYSLERPVMLREYASGLYSVSAYCLSKDILEYPIIILLVLIYLTLGYFIGGLQGNYLLLLLGMILIGLASAATSFLLSASATTVDMGALFGTYVLVLETLLSGFFVRFDQVPQVLRWIQWINPLRYGLSIMFIAEFNNKPGHEDLFSSNQTNPDMILFYIFMLVGLIVILRFAGILVLWFRTRKSSV